MRRLIPLALLLPVLALAACGGDDDTTTTVEEPGVSQTSSIGTDTTATQPAGSGPEGPLTAKGVGPVERGASTSEIEEAFGPADREQTSVGCELGGPDAPEILTWTYDLGEGELILSFDDPASGELGSYRVTSPSLETTLGDRVGDDFEELSHNWGSDLEKFPLGQPTPENGIWSVSDGPENKLLFDVQGARITSISGGFVQVCE